MDLESYELDELRRISIALDKLVEQGAERNKLLREAVDLQRQGEIHRIEHDTNTLKILSGDLEIKPLYTDEVKPR